MENRLGLNKRPVYELPDEVLIGEYRARVNKVKVPNFEPDICLNSKHNIKIDNKYNRKDQIWVKTNNERLIDFISSYNFDRLKDNGITGINNLSISIFKKILLEEFYEVKHGE